MNILFVVKQFPNIGGVEVITLMLAKQFISDGHKVYVITLLPKSMDSVVYEIPKEIEIIELATPVWCSANKKKLKDIIRNNKIDVIVNQWALHPEIAYICNVARKETECQLISVLHGAPDTTKMIIEQTEKVTKSKNIISKSFNQLKLKIYHFITKLSIKYVYRISNHYVLLSKGFIPKLVEYANLNSTKKLCAIGNAISISSEGYKYDFDNKKKQILYVGRMDPYNKRVNRIVEAWEQVYKEYSDWSLELVGEGIQLPALKQYVHEKNIQRVNFHGFQKEQPRKFYEDASILLLTSDLEGFGLVIIEAMQFGVVPIVYGSYVAVYDIIDNEKNGFITSMPYDRNQTIKCIRKLIDNNILRHNMAVSAIEKSKEFSIERICGHWYSLFENKTNN